ncbi:ATP-binding cassette subfamily B protein [Allocatelliglobosispora scoriae]|uniref:ATP-binding cassette subfamily B protein n=1 Tax=Allocatelliglobosispora scoriae TaxID=643052 RepID=A0A841BK82_9ACTN|nr:ABC transporter ATP-binding protein [Allocatelliglobosispora scoriae]MBB5867589.1 ATP-binding cassette subfamily B protein [Allocatelliglobosispora scoriae]
MTSTTTQPRAGLWSDAVGARWRIARLLPAAGIGASTAAIVLSLLRGLLPVAFALAVSTAVGRIPAALAGGAVDLSGLWRALIAACGALIGLQLAEAAQKALGERLSRRVDGHMYARLIQAALSSREITPLEEKAVLDELGEASHELRFAFRTPGAAYAGLIALVGPYTQVAGFTVVVAAALNTWAALAVLTVVLLFRQGQRGGLRRYARVIRDVAAIRRESRYLRETAMGAGAAKELRIFGLTGWFADRYREVYLRTLAPVWAERRRIYLKPYLAYTLVGLTLTAVVLALAGRRAAGGALDLAGLALVLQAVMALLRLGEFYPDSDTQTQYGMNAATAISRFEAAMARHTEPDDPAAAGAAARIGTAPQIRFAGVRFGYPGADRPVLDGLELTLASGTCTAIVGVNGAGKTTLVKLLARLYSPTSGAVLADGVDLAGLPTADWQARIAVVFQDFVRYELSAAANIGFGAVGHLDDTDGIRRAADAAGILAALDGLPHGLDTLLSRAYDDGTDLSGGQWQRIAIARALFALYHGSSILVLDEPTAALDVRAEAEFYARFAELTRGRTTVLISHRFASVRLADHIVLLDGGRVAEQGTHDELVALGGRYAAMFTLQAERFDTDTPVESPDDAAQPQKVR